MGPEHVDYDCLCSFDREDWTPQDYNLHKYQFNSIQTTLWVSIGQLSLSTSIFANNQN